MSTHLDAVRRPGIVYGFHILDPRTKDTPVDYVGKTVQQLDARERQHRGPDWETDPSEQPWSDLIVGKPVVLERGLWTAAELDEREQFHIRRLRPRYNYEFNLDNPNRIPIPEARRQREARNAARGVVTPSWGPNRAAVRPRTVRPTVHRLSRRQQKFTALAGTWASMSGAGWWAAVTQVGLVGWSAPLTGAVAAVVLMAVVALTVAEVRDWWNSRRARRQRRRLALRVTALTVAAALAGLLYVTVPHLLAHVPAQAR